MMAEPSGVFRTAKGDVFLLEGPLAVRGWPGCESTTCTNLLRRDPGTGEYVGECVGWHCPRCGEPTSMMGHDCKEAGGA